MASQNWYQNESNNLLLNLFANYDFLENICQEVILLKTLIEITKDWLRELKYIFSSINAITTQ